MKGSKDYNPFEIFAAEPLVLAVEETFHELAANSEQPGSEDYKDFARLKRRIISAIRSKWSASTGYPQDEFSHRPDAVMRMWTHLRKRTGEASEKRFKRPE